MKDFRDFNLAGGAHGFAHDPTTQQLTEASSVLDENFLTALDQETAWRTDSPESQAFLRRCIQATAEDASEQAGWDKFAHNPNSPRR